MSRTLLQLTITIISIKGKIRQWEDASRRDIARKHMIETYWVGSMVSKSDLLGNFEETVDTFFDVLLSIMS